MFQFSLVLGAPFGEATMGGIFKGVLPLKFRILALIQSIILLFFMIVILIRAEVMLSEYYFQSTYVVWYIALFFLVGSVLNMITKSRIERLIWAPVNIILFTATVFIALS